MRDEKGISLVESLVALGLMQLALLAVAPLFVLATRSTASAATMGQVGAAAVSRFETLRNQPFNALTAGNYSDTTVAGVVLSWTITNDIAPPDTHIKDIAVTARATRAPIGQAKQIVLRGKRAK